MSSSTSNTMPPRDQHLKDLTLKELEKRHDDLMIGHNRLLKAINEDYPEFQGHVRNNLPIRPMTKKRSRLLTQSNAVKNELLAVQIELEKRSKHGPCMDCMNAAH
jgi:hypothetical protein